MSSQIKGSPLSPLQVCSLFFPTCKIWKSNYSTFFFRKLKLAEYCWDVSSESTDLEKCYMNNENCEIFWHISFRFSVFSLNQILSFLLKIQVILTELTFYPKWENYPHFKNYWPTAQYPSPIGNQSLSGNSPVISS